MKTYQAPNTQLVRLSSGEVVLTNIELTIAGSGGNQGNAMAPRRMAPTPKLP